MSVEALAVVLHHSRAKGTDKLILIGIANHATDSGAWPAIATLARYANVEERTVQRSLTNLAKLGELAVWPQAGGGVSTPAWKRPNRYEVLVACPLGCDRTPNHRVRDLPDTQASLWITGVTPTTPGDAHVTGGVTPTSPEPLLEPTTPITSEENVTVPRARCDLCGLTFAECKRREGKSGHAYTPAEEVAS